MKFTLKLLQLAKKSLGYVKFDIWVLLQYSSQGCNFDYALLTSRPILAKIIDSQLISNKSVHILLLYIQKHAGLRNPA